MAEREELDRLRALWRDLPPPAAREELDGETERAVAWMRAAWSTLESPPLPASLRAGFHRREAGPVVLAVLAAAALLLLGLRLVVGDAGVGRGSNGVATARGEQTPGERAVERTTERPGGDEAPGMQAEASPLVVIAPDRIEMRQGSVRLILLRQDEAAGDPDPGEPR